MALGKESDWSFGVYLRLIKSISTGSFLIATDYKMERYLIIVTRFVAKTGIIWVMSK